MSKYITGQEAYNLLNEAVALIIKDNNEGLCYGQPDIDYMDEEGFHLILSYQEEDGSDIEYTFVWKEKDQILVDHNRIYLAEEDGKGFVGIQILEIKTL